MVRRRIREREVSSSRKKSDDFQISTPHHHKQHPLLQRSSIGPQDVLTLQRTIGNQAVMRLLGVNQAGSVQRYPEEVFLTGRNINWKKKTESVVHPGEGVSGGVYIFHGKQKRNKPEPVPDVVIKPEYMAEQGDVETAEALLRRERIATPNSRIVDKDSKEGRTIRETSDAKGQTIPDAHTDTLQDEHPMKFISVMEKVPGVSLASMAHKARNPQESGFTVNKLITMLQNKSLISRIAHMIVVDALMENTDRVTIGKANVGNIMLTDDQVFAIDSASDIVRANSRNNYSMLDDIVDQPATVAQKFLNGIAFSISGHGQMESNEEAAFKQGVTALGLADKYAQAMVTWMQTVGQPMQSDDELIAKRRKYLRLRITGTSKDAALQQVTQ